MGRPAWSCLKLLCPPCTARSAAPPVPCAIGDRTEPAVRHWRCPIGISWPRRAGCKCPCDAEACDESPGRNTVDPRIRTSPRVLLQSGGAAGISDTIVGRHRRRSLRESAADARDTQRHPYGLETRRSGRPNRSVVEARRDPSGLQPERKPRRSGASSARSDSRQTSGTRSLRPPKRLASHPARLCARPPRAPRPTISISMAAA